MPGKQTINPRILEENERVHVVTRRLFEGDSRRHFVGIVKSVSERVARVKGYVFVFDTGTGKYVRRPELRTRIFALTDANLVINILPKQVDIGSVNYRLNGQRQLIVTDETHFALNMDEFNVR